MLDKHQEDFGRTGLSQMEITPLLYLQLAHALETGQKVTHNKKPLLYNETQLKMAFSHYLRDNHEKNKSRWTQSEARNMDRLYKLATEIVKDDIDEAKKENNKNRKKGLAPEIANKKLFALLAEHDLLSDQEENIEFEGQQKATKADKILRTALTAENALEMLALAGEPTATVAVGLLVIAAQSQLTDTVLKFLLETYENKAHNIYEQEAIANTVDKNADPNFLLQKNEDIKRINNSKVKPEAKENTPQPKLLPGERAGIEEKRAQFRDNQTMTQIPVFAKADNTVKRKRERMPWEPPDILDGPKIYLGDPGLQGSERRRSDDQ